MPNIFKSELDLEIPKDVKFKLDGNIITVEGEKGKLTKDFGHMKGIELTYDKDKFILNAYFPRKAVVSKMGTLKSIVQNMITIDCTFFFM